MRDSLVCGKIKVELLWFDSLGAKSSSLLITTPDIKILVDPGAAKMQPSYPLSEKEKERLRECAMERIADGAKRADAVFISHYHYDHHTLPSKLKDPKLFYSDKKIWAKSPNLWINLSQAKRARLFFSELKEHFGGDEMYCEPAELDAESLVRELPSTKREFGDYAERRKELLEKGNAWFMKMADIWQRGPHIRPFLSELTFVDGKRLEIGETVVRFTKPLFHGIEFDRIGWVIPLIVEHCGNKFIYTSDIQGPQIEPYSEWLIQENPDILVADGFPTYLFGYMANRINLNRAVENMLRIVEQTKASPIIYDHHLLRDKRYKELLKPVYDLGRDRVLTAAEWMDREPLIKTL